MSNMPRNFNKICFNKNKYNNNKKIKINKET